MPTISFSNGLASGLDTQAIIDALILAERRPAVLLENRVAQRTGQVTALKSLSALLVSLGIESKRLSQTGSFDAFRVDTTDEDVATGTATKSSALGAYTMSVGSVAQAQALISQGYASAADSVGSGSVSIQVGSGSATTVTLDSGSATLSGLRDAINASGADVTASVVNTGSGATPYRLILTSKKSGAANQVAFTSNLSSGTSPVFSTSLSGTTKSAGFAGTATFTNVGPAVAGTYAGTATATSAGSYTGASTRAYAFTAQNGGTVGMDAITFAWNDGAGKTGSVVVPAGYVAGAEVAVANGLTVEFAAGSVVADDAFSVATTGRGTYIGTTGKTFAFTVTTGGTVGTDPIAIGWTDGAGGSGTINLPASYAARSQVAVAEGVVVAFDGGTLVAGDAFTIAATTPLLQAAQDATITLGSAVGGGNPVTITSDTNDFKNLIDGLTVTVRKPSAEPVTLDVSQDTEAVKESIKNFVDRYNGVVDFLKTQTTFDTERETKGPLFGDPVLLRVDSRLRRLATTSVPGVSGAFKALSSVGITTDNSGKLSLNEGKLDAALASDIDSVRKLFATVGSTTDSDLQLLDPGKARPSTTNADSTIAANGYAVVITRAAERARVTGATITDPATTPLVITATNSVVRVKVNGILGSDVTIAQGTYSSGSALADEIESKLNADGSLGVNRVEVSWVPGGSGEGSFEVQSTNYGESATISLEQSVGSVWTGALGFSSGQLGVSDTGVDVAGTIGGEEAHGDGQILVGGPKDPEEAEDWDTLGIRLLIPLSAGDLAAQGGAQGTVRLSAGVGSLFTRELDRLTDGSTGTLSSRERTVNRQIESLKDHIERIDARIEKRRRLLENQFARLERAVAELQAQGQFLGGQLSGLGSGSVNSTQGR